MIKKIKSVFPLDLSIIIFALSIFCIYKFPHLSWPLFWDELGVYGNGIFMMSENSLSLLPNALPEEISRGHPLLFTFFHSLIFKLTASHLFTAHVTGLFISIATILSIRYIGGKLFNPQTGLFAALLFLSQPIFVSQSILILPESFLTFMSLWAIYFYLRSKWVGYFFFCSCSLLIKESSIIIPLACLIYSILICKKYSFKTIFISLLPIIPYLTFLILQKIQKGWFFFPYHLKGIDLSIDKIIFKSGKVFDFIFLMQGRWSWIFLIIVLVCLTFYFRKKNIPLKVNPLSKNALSICAIWALLFIGFTISNFYMHRYLLVFFPFICLSLSFMISILIKSNAFKIISLSFICIPSIYSLTDKAFYYDVNMGYGSLIKNQLDFFEYFENSNIPKHRFYANFPLNLAFSKKEYGYIKNTYELQQEEHMNPNCKYYIISNPGNKIGLPEELDLKQIKVFKYNYSTISIFESVSKRQND